MEEVSQVLDAFIGKIPIIVTPGKLLLDIPTRLQGLEREKHFKSCNLAFSIKPVLYKKHTHAVLPETASLHSV